MAEQFRFQQIGGYRRAIDRHEWTVAASAQTVQRFRHQFFTSPALPAYHDGHVRPRHLFHLLVQLLHRGMFPDHQSVMQRLLIRFLAFASHHLLLLFHNFRLLASPSASLQTVTANQQDFLQQFQSLLRTNRSDKKTRSPRVNNGLAFFKFRVINHYQNIRLTCACRTVSQQLASEFQPADNDIPRLRV